jgi:hypothetical protein
MFRTLPLALALFGCTSGPAKDVDPDDTAVSDSDTDADTDTDTDTDADTDTAELCTRTVLGTAPADAEIDVYYRAPLVVSFDGDGSIATFSLADAGGAEVAFETTWTDGNVQASLATVLAPSTTYTLSVDVCGVVTTSTFTTSSLGSALTVANADLIGRTYVWRLSDATITEPSFLEFVAGTYLTTPLLVSVTAADETSLDLIGGVGNHENDGTYTQVMTEDTWDFPAGDFTENPYFEAYSDLITVTYQGTPIPIEQFHLSGTFTADGTAIEKGVGTGFGDSRHMGPLVHKSADDLTAVCEIAAAAGVECQPCADGEPYCLYIVAEDITAEWAEGLSITPVP